MIIQFLFIKLTGQTIYQELQSYCLKFIIIQLRMITQIYLMKSLVVTYWKMWPDSRNEQTKVIQIQKLNTMSCVRTFFINYTKKRELTQAHNYPTNHLYGTKWGLRLKLSFSPSLQSHKKWILLESFCCYFYSSASVHLDCWIWLLCDKK